MCGIVGCTTNVKGKNVLNFGINGLHALEYRGYDSAGGAFFNGNGNGKNSIHVEKALGQVHLLENKIGRNGNRPVSSCGIFHTRWATHGVPSVKNAHPHFDCKKRIYVVHNGIVENFKALKVALQKEGHIFRSDTDTEVISHLVERYKVDGISLEDAVVYSLREIVGTFAVAIISKDEPGKIVAARRSSPLIIGRGEGENFLASDASALAEHTRRIIYIKDDEVVVLTPSDVKIFDLKKNHRKKIVESIIDWDVEKSQKKGFPHFMLKEIHEQPESLNDSLRGRILLEEGKAKLGGLEVLNSKVNRIKKFLITACGTAFYAGFIGKYMFEEFAGIPTEVDLASELRYRHPIIDKHTAMLVVSQSGETADTLAALDLAKKRKNLCLGIVNTVGSSVARKTDAGVYNHIGPENGVASTKAFTSQLAVLALFTLFFGRKKKMSKTTGRKISKALLTLPNQVKETLKKEKQVKRLVRKYKDAKDFLFLGRGVNYPAALEGALKLKEVSYVHAEGYGAGEMKHGPIALIDENFPTMAILGDPNHVTYSKTLSNLQEIKARKGPIIAIAQEGDEEIAKVADDVFYVPKTMEMLSPILNIVPLQLFAYHMAVLRGLDPDKPRNLAKSVTVE